MRYLCATIRINLDVIRGNGFSSSHLSRHSVYRNKFTLTTLGLNLYTTFRENTKKEAKDKNKALGYIVLFPPLIKATSLLEAIILQRLHLLGGNRCSVSGSYNYLHSEYFAFMSLATFKRTIKSLLDSNLMTKNTCEYDPLSDQPQPKDTRVNIYRLNHPAIQALFPFPPDKQVEGAAYVQKFLC